MRKHHFGKTRLIKAVSIALSAFLSVYILFSSFMILQITSLAENAGGRWDYKAYQVSENDIYPTQYTMSNGWGWNCRVTQNTDNLEFKYNIAYPYPYTVAIKQISVNNAHITLSVEGADSFILLFGNKQAHKDLQTFSLIFNKTARTVTAGIAGSTIDTLTDTDVFGGGTMLDIRLNKTDSGYRFSIDESFEYILTNEKLAANSGLKNTYDSGAVWFNIAPNNSAPDFKIYSVHSGTEICYDDMALTFTEEQMNGVFSVISIIDAIGNSITLESKTAIDTARLSYDSLDDTLKPYVSNYDKLEYAEEAYKSVLRNSVNIDSVLYPVELSNVGPNHYSWPTSTINWYKAASGTGVTLEYNNTTVHQAGLNVDNRLSFDGMHFRFANCKFENYGENFAIIFHTAPQIDLNNSSKTLWLYFSVTDTGVSVSVQAKGKSAIPVIQTSSITKQAMELAWEFKTEVRTDGGYNFILNGSVSGIIPSDYINAAKSAGLDTDSTYVCLCSNNYSGAAYHLKMDCISAHDCKSICSDELYDNYGTDAMTALSDCIKAIDAIETPITLESGLAIMTAESYYNALTEELKGYVTKYDNLVAMRRRYDKLNNTFINLDPVVYPEAVDNVGPNHYWPTEYVDWYPAEASDGVTVRFNNTTVHSVGLTVGRPVSLDGLHMHFGKTEFRDYGNQFALIFDNNSQIDLTSDAKDMWLEFIVGSDNVKVILGAHGKSEIIIINSEYITAADFADEWDIEINKKSSGDYEIIVCGISSGTIPAEYINAAADNGMPPDSLNVTLGSYNLGAGPYYLKTDVLAVHDGKKTCYCKVAAGDYAAVKECEELIDAIGTVDKTSGAAIKAAQDAFDSLTEYLQGLVTNATALANKAKEYNRIASDVAAALKLETVINSLSDTISDANYDAYLDVYFDYLDLFPRIRKYVTNSPKLLNAVAAYEAANPGVNLSHEAMNRYTKGENAHYLKEITVKTFLDVPMTGDKGHNMLIVFAVTLAVSLAGMTGLLVYMHRYNKKQLDK